MSLGLACKALELHTGHCRPHPCFCSLSLIDPSWSSPGDSSSTFSSSPFCVSPSSYFFDAMLRIKPRTLYVLDMCANTDLCSRPLQPFPWSKMGWPLSEVSEWWGSFLPHVTPLCVASCWLKLKATVKEKLYLFIRCGFFSVLHMKNVSQPHSQVLRYS